MSEALDCSDASDDGVALVYSLFRDTNTHTHTHTSNPCTIIIIILFACRTDGLIPWYTIYLLRGRQITIIAYNIERTVGDSQATRGNAPDAFDDVIFSPRKLHKRYVYSTMM